MMRIGSYWHLLRRKMLGGKRVVRLSPPVLLVLGFVLFITLGALLLKLPLASNAPTTWLNAFFTATSAVTVTGLAVLDTGTHFTVG